MWHYDEITKQPWLRLLLLRLQSNFVMCEWHYVHQGLHFHRGLTLMSHQVSPYPDPPYFLQLFSFSFDFHLLLLYSACTIAYQSFLQRQPSEFFHDYWKMSSSIIIYAQFFEIDLWKQRFHLLQQNVMTKGDYPHYSSNPSNYSWIASENYYLFLLQFNWLLSYFDLNLPKRTQLTHFHHPWPYLSEPYYFQRQQH